MAKKLTKKKCINHPKRLTARKCFKCKSFICSTCIIKHDHHLFCSNKCIKEYGVSKSKSKKKSVSNKKQSISVFSKKDIVYISLIAILIFFVLNDLVTKIKLPDEEKPVYDISQSWQPMVFQKELTLQIEPQLPDSLIITVWINGKYFSTLEKTNEIKIPAQVLNSGSNNIKLLSVSQAGSKIIFEDVFSFNNLRGRKRNYIRLPGRGRRIALTFDGGSNNNAVDSIINILQKYDIKATAFLTGQFIKKFPQDVLKIVKSKRFAVGNHSYSHPHLTTYADNRKHLTLSNITFQTVKKQLSKTDSLFAIATGKHLAKFWRAPFGEYNSEILNWTSHFGYSHLYWSRGFDTFDWVKDTASSIYYTPEEMWEKWQTLWKNEPERFKGAIVLMHLGNDREKPMYKFLHKFIPFIQKQGYKFVDVNDI